ncbi:MAG TPA: AIR synthase related protein, partial [Acidimicrobiia bacterium]|nr:AIR synthase related protein [Acidimicrobiia bacterium]
MRALLGQPPPGEVWAGDDTAVLGDGLLFAVDALVAGVHFDLGWSTPEEVGWKAVAVNVSDLAAMG